MERRVGSKCNQQTRVCLPTGYVLGASGSGGGSRPLEKIIIGPQAKVEKHKELGLWNADSEFLGYLQFQALTILAKGRLHVSAYLSSRDVVKLEQAGVKNVYISLAYMVDY